MKKSQLKRNQKPLRKVPLKKESTKSAKQKHNEREELKEEDNKFYMTIWQSRNRKCQLSDRYLGSEIMKSFFHHLLPKESYPQFRHEDWNIIQIRTDLHSQIETNIYLLEEDYYDKYMKLLNMAKEKALLI